MLFLAIETSSTRGSLALLSAETCLKESFFPEGLIHGREIMTQLDELLRHAGAGPRDLKAVSVSGGPGSFTGLRVGITAAKSLAFALRIPAVAESSLKVLAGNALESPCRPLGSRAEGADQTPADSSRSRWVLTALDLRGGMFSAGLFQVPLVSPRAGSPATGSASPEGVLPRVPPQALTPEALLTAVEQDGAGQDRRVISVIGDAADSFLEWLSGAASRDAEFVRGLREWDRPRASVLGRLTVQEVSRTKFDLEAIHRLEPTYLRLSDAEQRLLSRRKP